MTIYYINRALLKLNHYKLTVTTVNESEEAGSNSLELPLCIIGYTGLG